MEVAYWGATNILAAPLLAWMSREVWGCMVRRIIIGLWDEVKSHFISGERTL